MKGYSRSIDEQIRKAIEDGSFDDLPGKGKPLDLQQNPHEDPAWRMAFRMLGSSGYSLPWIEKRQQIEKDYDAACEALARSWNWYRSAGSEQKNKRFVEQEWQRAVEVFRETIAKLNKLIRTYNIEVPSEQFQRRPINIEREITRITASAD